MKQSTKLKNKYVEYMQHASSLFLIPSSSFMWKFLHLGSVGEWRTLPLMMQPTYRVYIEWLLMRVNYNKLLFYYFVLTAKASMKNWVWYWTELNQIQIVTIIFIQMNYLCTQTVFFLLTREFVMELQGNFLVVNHIQIVWKWSITTKVWTQMS